MSKNKDSNFLIVVMTDRNFLQSYRVFLDAELLDILS